MPSRWEVRTIAGTVVEFNVDADRDLTPLQVLRLLGESTVQAGGETFVPVKDALLNWRHIASIRPARRESGDIGPN